MVAWNLPWVIRALAGSGPQMHGHVYYGGLQLASWGAILWNCFYTCLFEVSHGRAKVLLSTSFRHVCCPRPFQTGLPQHTLAVCRSTMGKQPARLCHCFRSLLIQSSRGCAQHLHDTGLKAVGSSPVPFSSCRQPKTAEWHCPLWGYCVA